MQKLLFFSTLLLLSFVSLFTCTENELDMFDPPWPSWIFTHWVWEDESTSESAINMVDGYLSRDIPVGAIIIDSPWATGYSTFEFDTDLYPDPQSLIDYMHSRDIRVFLWTVSTINLDSPNYNEALNKGYFIGDGAVVEWWKGPGSFIDYTNPDAVKYWHGLLDNVLEMGIDGWKTDGTDFNVAGLPDKTTFTGEQIDLQTYREQYYGDFFYYTRQNYGKDKVITARPVDAYGLGVVLDNLTRFAPKEVNYCGWVGDQDPDFTGLKNAMINILLSSKDGYLGHGSDIAGYRGDGLRDKDLFIRWAQYGAFCPIMENGGSGIHFPWEYDQETVEIYRTFVNIHHQLIDYFMEEYESAYKENRSVILPPVGSWDGYEAVNIPESTDYCYRLGRDIFVAPFYSSGTVRTFTFPSGDDWVDWWDDTVYTGGTGINYDCPLDKFPVFIRKGSKLERQIKG